MFIACGIMHRRCCQQAASSVHYYVVSIVHGLTNIKNNYNIAESLVEINLHLIICDGETTKESKDLANLNSNKIDRNFGLLRRVSLCISWSLQEYAGFMCRAGTFMCLVVLYRRLHFKISTPSDG